MNRLSLNISNLVLDVNLSALGSGSESRLGRKLSETFSGFINHNGHSPREILDVLPLRMLRKKGTRSDLESLILKSMKVPLSKFPFTTDLKKETDYLKKKLRPLCKDSGVQAFLNRSKNPEDIVFYLLNNGCLIRNRYSNNAALFLKSMSGSGVKAASVYGAIYFIASMALPLLNTLLLHGVGISRQGRGLLFLGLSGSGKTTLARFSPMEEIISDDGVILEEEGIKYYIQTSPFDQLSFLKQKLNAFSAGRIPLAMGLFLEKDSRVYLEKVSPSEACSRILTNHIHYYRYFFPETVEKIFYLVTSICRQIPFYRLHFKKDPSFWPIIEKELSEIL